MKYQIDKIENGYTWVTFIKDDGTKVQHPGSIANLPVSDADALTLALDAYSTAYFAGLESTAPEKPVDGLIGSTLESASETYNPILDPADNGTV